MATVTLSQIDGASWTLTRAGWTITRIATVDGVVGTGEQIVFNAYQALVGAGVDINTNHPIIPLCVVTEIVPTALSSDQVVFRITYQQYNFHTAVIEVGNSVSQVETDKDVDGKLQTVEYDYPADYEYNTDLQGITKTQPGYIQKIQPEPPISITRTELITGIDLTAKKLEYEGTVNDGPWRLDPSAEAKTWLCTGIGGRSEDNGISYDVTYTFIYRKDGWDDTIRFVDPNTGQTPSDIVEGHTYNLSGVGSKPVKTYAEKNFDALELL